MTKECMEEEKENVDRQDSDTDREDGGSNTSRAGWRQAVRAPTIRGVEKGYKNLGFY